jgi:hypothetical protein
MPIDFQHLVRAIVDHRVARGRTAVTGNEHAASELEREDRSRLRLRHSGSSRSGAGTVERPAASSPRLRSNAGKSSTPPENAESSAAIGSSITDRSLPIALRLVRIDFAHLLQQVLRVRARNVRRLRPLAIATLLWSPRNRRLLHPLWHVKSL